MKTVFEPFEDEHRSGVTVSVFCHQGDIEAVFCSGSDENIEQRKHSVEPAHYADFLRGCRKAGHTVIERAW